MEIVWWIKEVNIGYEKERSMYVRNWRKLEILKSLVVYKYFIESFFWKRRWSKGKKCVVLG